MRWIVKNLPDDWQDDYQGDTVVLRADASPATLEEIFIATCEINLSRPAESTADSEVIDLDEPSEVA